MTSTPAGALSLWTTTEKSENFRGARAGSFCRARALAATLRGYEMAVEDAAEHVPTALEREIVAHCVASGLFAPNLPEAMGGAGLSLREQVVIEEELGGVTNWLSRVDISPALPRFWFGAVDHHQTSDSSQ